MAISPVAGDDNRECPFCAEMIPMQAKVCRFCNRKLSSTADATAATSTGRIDNLEELTPNTLSKPLAPKFDRRTDISVILRQKKRNRIIIVLLCTIGGIALFFRLFCGIFVIQPIGAIPDGLTIVYWRSGLNLPFIASVDGLLDESGAGVSLFGRGLMLAKLAEPIKSREIFRVGYSETLYLWSTGGKAYNK